MDDDEESRWKFLDVAIMRLYSPPDASLLHRSSHTMPPCTLLPDLIVLPIEQILSVVAMIPHRPMLPSGVVEDRFFVLEKPGLDICESDGLDEDDEVDR